PASQSQGLGSPVPPPRLAHLLQLPVYCRGAFSYVRRVTEKSSGLDYAAKFIPCRAKAKQSACRELQILSQLDHERLVYFHDSFEKKNAVIIVMELYPPGIISVTSHHPPRRFRYSEDDVAGYVLQLLQGLEYLHGRRIVHLDIKPDNVLVTPSNAVKIIDFGSAQSYNPLVLRRLGRRVGTLEFMLTPRSPGRPEPDPLPFSPLQLQRW
uniref:Protein kinase domain-containing protein n=1 Tax=Gopherus evgoodei TaxID=1825980 RepID=A0A8C4WHK7_9SAUR